ncbi:MAG TPA: hypothetical protein VGF79_14755 [Bacteroidia bacterium]
MKHLMVFVFSVLLLNEINAQNRPVKYTIPPIVDSLTEEMKTQSSFVFSSKGKQGYYELENGIVVPARFNSVTKMEIEGLGDNLKKYAPAFFKIQYGKYYGIYRYKNDTLQMLPCKYDSVCCKFIENKIYMIAYKGNKVDSFDGNGKSQMPVKIKKFDGLVEFDSNVLYEDVEGSGSALGIEGSNNFSYKSPQLVGNGKYAIIQSRMSPNKFEVINAKTKKIIIKEPYKGIKFNEKRGLFVCSNDSVVSLIDTLGKFPGEVLEWEKSKFIVRESLVDVYDFYVAKSYKEKKYGIMDRNYNWLVHPIYDAYQVSPHERFVGLYNGVNWKIYDNKTRKMNDYNFESYYTSYEHRYGLVKISGEMMLYDSVTKTAQVINDCKFIQTVDTLAILNKGNQFVVVNLKNAKQTIVDAIELSFYNIDKHTTKHRYGYSEQLMLIKNDGKVGLINSSNKIYIPTVYDSIFLVRNNTISKLPYLLMKRDGLYYYHSIESNKMVQDSINQLYFNRNDLSGVFNNSYKLTGRELVFPYVIQRNQLYHRIYDIDKKPSNPRKFDTVIYRHDNYWITRSKEGYCIWKLTSNEFEKGFDSIALIKNYDMNFHFMFKNKRCFAVDRVSAQIAPTSIFETFEPRLILLTHEPVFHNKKMVLSKYEEKLYLFILMNKSKLGVLFPNGEFTEIIYDDVCQVKNNKLVWAKINGKWGLFRY